MQLVMKIAEEKRMNSKGMKALFNYIARESGVYKTIGIGMSDDKDKAFRQTQANKKRFNKAIDDKMRFCFHEIISLEYGTDKELALKIAIEYCQKEYEEKGYNCFIGVHTDTKNTHIHILIDTVNFRNGKMLQSLTEKQLEKVPEREFLEEVHIYERQRKLVEDIAISHGYEIEDSKRYEAMHEAKKYDKNARKWLTKNQYKVFKQDEEKSWRNDIANKIKEMYKRLDLTEENVNEIASEYGLTITRHNKEKHTITFATVENGEATKNRIKLERLHDQEKANFTSETNPFDYNNFFRDRTKEIENNKDFEDFVKEIEAEEIAKELEKVMKEKEKTIKEVAENLIEAKENIYKNEKEKAEEISKMIEINQRDYKQDLNKISSLEKELIEKKEEIPSLEEDIKIYTNNKTILEEKLPTKEIEAEKKIDIADEKAKEVARLKALLKEAEREFSVANEEKEEAIKDRDSTKEKIENIDTLIKNSNDKIVENNEKIKSIPTVIEVLKDSLEDTEKKIEAHREDLKVVSENVKQKEQDYKEIKDSAFEKVLEYESILKSFYERKYEAEEQNKTEMAEAFKKEYEEFQNELLKQNIELEKINKLNREVAEQVRLEREQKAITKKKEEAEARRKEVEARAKILSEEKAKTDLINFISLLDKGKISNENLIELVEDLKEFEEAEDRNPVQHSKNIKFRLCDLDSDIRVNYAIGNTEKAEKLLTENTKLFERISNFMENMEQQKTNPNIREADKKDTKEVRKEEREIE